jgi:thymidine phosphorylase
MGKLTKSEGVTAELKVRRLAIDTYRENVAYLHRACPIYRAEGFQALAKVAVGTDGHQILAVLNVVDDEKIVAPTELGLSEQAFAQLAVPELTLVHIAHAEPPDSLDAVRRKIAGQSLTQGIVIRRPRSRRF